MSRKDRKTMKRPAKRPAKATKQKAARKPAKARTKAKAGAKAGAKAPTPTPEIGTGPGSDAAAALRPKSPDAAPVLVHGHTLTEIAGMVGISASGVSKLWLGKRAPSINVALRLASGLGITLAEAVVAFGSRALHREREQRPESALPADIAAAIAAVGAPEAEVGG